MKVEYVGDQEAVDKLRKESHQPKVFVDIKGDAEEVLLRACDYVSLKKIPKAVMLYLEVAQTVNFAETSNEDEKKQRNDLLKRVHTNLAICFNSKL